MDENRDIDTLIASVKTAKSAEEVQTILGEEEEYGSLDYVTDQMQLIGEAYHRLVELHREKSEPPPTPVLFSECRPGDVVYTLDPYVVLDVEYSHSVKEWTILDDGSIKGPSKHPVWPRPGDECYKTRHDAILTALIQAKALVASLEEAIAEEK
jgi:hypothetical protein